MPKPRQSSSRLLQSRKMAARMPPRQPLWTRIRDYLSTVGGSDAIESMVSSLLDRGDDLGRYPKRTVSSCLSSRQLANVFVIETNSDGTRIVSLRSQETGVLYIPSANRSGQSSGDGMPLPATPDTGTWAKEGEAVRRRGQSRNKKRGLDATVRARSLSPQLQNPDDALQPISASYNEQSPPQPTAIVTPFPLDLIEMYPSLGRGKRERMVPCTLCLPISQIEELEKIKAEYGVPVSKMVRDFIAKCLHDMALRDQRA